MQIAHNMNNIGKYCFLRIGKKTQFFIIFSYFFSSQDSHMIIQSTKMKI